MKALLFLVAAALLSPLSLRVCAEDMALKADAPITIVIHGGAGALEPGRYTPEEEAEYKAKLREALDAGYGVLDSGGPALDAIVAAIMIMEDSPLVKAGRGAVFTSEGTNELDAAIMDGRTANAGAVAGVKRVKNPIRLARSVMEDSVHVMFAGAGAETFAEAQGLDMVGPDYFFTQNRFDSLQKALEREREVSRKEMIDDPVSVPALPKKKGAWLDQHPVDFKYGTVGAVALDRNGDLAAGTSTGGMTMKRWGRVGDVPIIGAGTYADNRSCAVSATGHGEYFIRLTIARDICAQIEYGDKTVTEAADDVINNRLETLGGDGGVIVLAPNGDYAMTFNSAGMFRGVKQENAAAGVAIYGEQGE